MHAKDLQIHNNRGFSDLAVKPRGHVVVMGEPGAGCSHGIEALGKRESACGKRGAKVRLWAAPAVD